MRRVHLAELRDSWSAWLGVSLAFVATNLSFVNSALVLASGWAAVDAGLITMTGSVEFTLTPMTNFVFSGIVGLMVLATSAQLVIDSRRGSVARLALAGATPAQVVSSLMTQLLTVSIASAIVADILGMLTLQPVLDFLTYGIDAGTVAVQIPASYDAGAMLMANVGCLVVVLLAGLGQARRAAGIAPVEALRQAAVDPGQKMTAGRWVVAFLGTAIIAGLFVLPSVLAPSLGKEAVSTFLQLSMLALTLFILVAAACTPLFLGPLARAWTGLIPVHNPMWQLARRNIYTRGTRFSRSIVPVIFTIGLMLGFLSLAPTVLATTAALGEAVRLEKANAGAFMSLLGPALVVALCGGIGNLFMMSKQRDAELALLGLAGATPSQRRLLPILEALILVGTAAIPGALSLLVMFAYMHVSFPAAGVQAVTVVPGEAWLLSVGGTGVIMVAATFVPTLSAMRLPERRVIARLAAE